MGMLVNVGAEVEEALDELRDESLAFGIAEIRSGTWLPAFVGSALFEHAGATSLESLRRTHPGLTDDLIVEVLVEHARRRGAAAVTVAAGQRSASIAALHASAGLSAPVAVSAGLLTLTTHMLYAARLQLRLAFDLSVLAGAPARVDDDGELADLVGVALGVGADAIPAENGPEGGGNPAVSAVGDRARRMLVKAGRSLYRRGLVRLTIPAASVPLAAALAYHDIGRTARVARAHYEDRVAVRDLVPAGGVAPDMVLDTMWLVLRAGGELTGQERWLLRDLTRLLRAADAGQEAAELEHLVDLREDEVLGDLATAPSAVRKGVWDAVSAATNGEGGASGPERAVLERIAVACGAHLEPPGPREVV